MATPPAGVPDQQDYIREQSQAVRERNDGQLRTELGQVFAEFFALLFRESPVVIAGCGVNLDAFAAQGLLLTAV